MRPGAVDTSKVIWGGVSPLNAQDVFDLTRKKKKDDKAKEPSFRQYLGDQLVEYLKQMGGVLPAGDSQSPQDGTIADWWKGGHGGEAWCSWRTLERAAKDRKIEMSQEKGMGKGWFWRLTAASEGPF